MSDLEHRLRSLIFNHCDQIAPVNAGALARAAMVMALEDAAKVAERRHEEWRLPHPDDAQDGEVCCDVTACEDIAAAIRALGEGCK